MRPMLSWMARWGRLASMAALGGCVGTCEPSPRPRAAAHDASPDGGLAEARPADAAIDARAASIEKGAQLYARYCDFCHGKDGRGYAADEAPALASDDLLTIASDEYLRDAILKGRPGTTMSAWGRARGGPLGADEANAIVALLRSWQTRPAEKLEERKVEGDPKRGAPIWVASCARCHGVKGTGGKYNALANPELLAGASNAFLATTIERGRSGTPMPPFRDKLSRADVDDVLALVRSWQQAPDAGVDLPPKAGELKNVVLNPKGPQPQFTDKADFVPVDTVKKELDRGATMILVDARAPGDYAMMHVAGSISVPFYEAEKYAPQIPKDRWILTYCACPHGASVKGRDALRALGYPHVAVLDEGINVWRDRGYPVRGGPKP